MCLGTFEVARLWAARLRKQPTSALSPHASARARIEIGSARLQRASRTFQPTGTGTGRGRHGANSAGLSSSSAAPCTILLQTDQGTGGTRDDHDIQSCAQESIIPRSHKYHSSPAFTQSLTLSLSHSLTAIRLSATSPSHSCITGSFDFTPPPELYYCCSSHLTGLSWLLRRVLGLSSLLVLLRGRDY